MHKLWLSGPQFNVDYLFDTASGEVLQTVVLPGTGGTTAGVGQYCGKRFVAIYVAPDRSGLVLQIDAARFPLDGQTKVEHRRRFGGTIASLSASRPGHDTLSITQVTVKMLVRRLIDPTYDCYQEMVDDYLADIADIASLTDRQRSFLANSDPDAGPWEYETRRPDRS